MTRDKKLEALVLVIWFIAVSILLILVWQFFLGPLYEAEKRIAHGLMLVNATRQQCMDMFFSDSWTAGYVENLAGRCWKLLQ